MPDSVRIAAIIPARNEASVIGAAIRTLKNQHYPAGLFEVFVVPNNCTDNTERAAVLAGAQILHCDSPVHTKGDVLQSAFRQLLEKDHFDAFCIFDADNLVSPGFFHEANNAYLAGYECAQGYRESKNPGDSWISGSMTVFYAFMGKIFNESRWRRNLSAHLNGTGIMIGADFIRKHGWNTATLTEDLEFTAQCALNGARIAFMPHAVVYDEQPVSFRSSAIQRRRWTAGSLQCMRRYVPALFRKRTPSALDAALFFSANIMNYIGVLSLPAFFLSQFLIKLIRNTGLAGILSGIFTYILILWTLLALAARLILSFSGITDTSKYTVLLFPLFMASWMVINIIASFSKPPRWKQIVHGSSAVPEAMRSESANKNVPG